MTSLIQGQLDPTASDITATGLTGRSLNDIKADIVARATSYSQGLTANLPASLLDDLISTSVSSVAAIEQARMDCINALLPLYSNENILPQQAALFGVKILPKVVNSVYLTFTGPVGFLLPAGIVVTDGTHSVVTSSPATIGQGGVASNVYASAPNADSFSAPANTFTTILTAGLIQNGITVSNPAASTPSGAAVESAESLRARVIMAMQATQLGTLATIYTAILNSDGNISPRLLKVTRATQTMIGLPTPLKAIVGSENGHPPSSSAVAQALANSVFSIWDFVWSDRDTSGPGSHSVSTPIYVGGNPFPTTVYFVIPTQVCCALTIHYHFSTSIPAPLVTDIQAAAQQDLKDYINSIPLGLPISKLVLQDKFYNSLAANAVALNPAFLDFFDVVLSVGDTDAAAAAASPVTWTTSAPTQSPAAPLTLYYPAATSPEEYYFTVSLSNISFSSL